LDYLEYTRDHNVVKSNNFNEWILSLKPKNLWEERMSEVKLKSQRAKIRNGKKLNLKLRIVKILSQSYDGI
jgi:hypothetical protein